MSSDLDWFPRTMLTLEQVLQLVPVSRTTLFRMERTGRFPAGHLIDAEGRKKVWFADEVRAWQATLAPSNVERKETA